MAKLVLRYRAKNIKLETTYCTNCKCNDHRNIGTLICVHCGKAK